MNSPTTTPLQPSARPEPTFRSGAVARLAGMPVSTLRIWEQRYQAVAPSTAPTGHRLYSAADVDRVVLLRQLTERGHAIGSLAHLDLAQLRNIACTPVQRQQAPAEHRSPGTGSRTAPRAPLRMLVVGRAMAHKLQRAAAQRPGAPRHVVAVFDTLAQAAQATRAQTPEPVDLLLWQTAGLQADALASLNAVQRAWAPCAVAVTYRFAHATARDALSRTGAVVVREPADDEALVTWLDALHSTLAEGAEPTDSAPDHPTAAALLAAQHPWLPAALAHADCMPPAPRFDDATLTTFAGLGNGVACDCPAHVAELLLQITAFETYSAGCAHRSPADEQLHAHLQRVAAAARVLFEHALTQVAQAEGWALPNAPADTPAWPPAPSPLHPVQKATP